MLASNDVAALVDSLVTRVLVRIVRLPIQLLHPNVNFYSRDLSDDSLFRFIVSFVAV